MTDAQPPSLLDPARAPVLPAPGAHPARDTRYLRFLLGVVAITLAALLLSPGLPYSDELDPTSAVVGMMGAVAWSATLGSAFFLVRVLLERWGESQRTRGLRWAASAAMGVVLFTGLGLYLASWILFHQVGTFLDREILGFVADNPRALFRHMTAAETAAGGCAVAVVALLWWVVMRASRPGAEPASGPPTLGTLGALLVSVACLHAYPLLFIAEEASAETYVAQALHRTAPDLALTSSLVGHAVGPRIPLLHMELEPIETPKAYARRAGAPERKLNVVLVLVEAMRRDSLVCLGAKESLMPFLDEIARDSLVLGNAYAPANDSRYSTTAILSSLYPLKYPGVDHFKDAQYPKTLLYEILKPFGYSTGVFSSANEHWGNMYDFLQSDAIDEFFHSEDWDGQTLVAPADTGFAESVRRGILKTGKLDDRITLDRFAQWLAKQPADNPVCAYLSLQCSHFPYQQAFELATPFEPHALDFPASFVSYPRDRTAVMRNRYWNSLAYIDDRLRQLFTALEEAGRAGDTLVIIAGDHGEAFYEHDEVTHAQSLYEEALRVPIVIWGPGDIVPHEIDLRPVNAIDIIPTVLGRLGLPRYPGFQGHDVLAPDYPEHRAIYLTTQLIQQQDAIIHHGYKLVWDHRRGVRLYDLARDPGEQHDLRRQHEARARKLLQQLFEWRKRQLSYYAHPVLHTRFHPPPTR